MTEPTLPGEEAEAGFHPEPTLLEKSCMWVCEVAILVMGAIVILEIVTRNLFGFSFEMSEEIGGYIIVGIAFLSLPVCQVYRSYHHVQFCLVLLWQLTRFVTSTYRSQDVAPTLLATPLWIPQAMMPIGTLAVSISLSRSILGNWRRYRAAGR